MPLRVLQNRSMALFERAFDRKPEIVCRAPGRIEFVGNHTDYNGGLVMGAAIDREVRVAMALRTDGRRRFCSEIGDTVWEHAGELRPVSGDAAWTNYPTGVLAAMVARGLRTPVGFDYAVVSDLPRGAGLSSSAAIELASALGFLGLTHQEVSREDLVNIGRAAENNFVGVPCGILDQGVSGFGRSGHLVAIDCRGPEFSTVAMPSGSRFRVFNTPSSHALVDGLYAARHRECSQAAEILGVSLLADASLEMLEAKRARMPDEVFRRARHVVEEIERVRSMRAALAAGDLNEVGALLTASHRSSQHLFANSTAQLDWLVDHLVPVGGVLGARLSGGGFGGAVMALTREGFGDREANRIAATFAEAWGQPPTVLALNTADGASTVPPVC